MKRHTMLSACTALLALSLSTAASAQGTRGNTSTTSPPAASAPEGNAARMTRDEYKAAKDRIEADAKAARANCGSLSGNAKDICQAEAKGKEKVDKAELEARYKNTAKARYDAQVAKADADYGVAKERCDDKSGKEKDACVKQAKASQAQAKADAKAQRKTSSADSGKAPAGRS